MNAFPSVLIVEDELPLIKVIEKRLQAANFQTHAARNGTQAMNVLEQGVHIDIIWLDHYLLGQEYGFDFLAEIKSPSSPWKNIPVVVVSDTIGPDKLEQYIDLGAEKYYIKSEKNLDQILQDIDRVLSQKDNE